MKNLLCIYLINGEDELKRAYVLDRLVERVSKLGDLSFNKDTFNAEKVEVSTLINACNTLPVLSEKRLVICTNVDKAPKELSEAIITYLASPNPDSILALTSAKLRKNSRLYKAVRKYNKKSVVDCSPTNRRNLPAHVRDIAASNGVFISDSAARELIDRVGESTVRIDTELKKMRMTLGYNANVGINEVRGFVARTTEIKPWTFSDALAARDTTAVAQLLTKIDTSQPYSYFVYSLNTVRSLLKARDFYYSASNAEVAAAIGVPEWKATRFRTWAHNFSRNELARAIMDAAELDYQMKTGGNAALLFETWVLSLCTGDKQR